MKIDKAEIYTIKDLIKYFDSKDLKEHSSMLGKMSNNINGSLNSNVDIKAFFNSKERDKFNTVVKDTTTAVKASRELIHRVNTKIGAIGISDLFTLDPTKDAVEYALSLKSGGDNMLQSMVAEFNENIKPLVDHVDNPSYDRNVGNMALVGAGKFLSELAAARNATDFMNAVGKTVGKQRSRIRNIFKNTVLFDRLQSNIKSLAFGKNTKLSAAGMAESILKDLYPDSMDKVLANKKAISDYIVREAAYLRMQKYEGSIKTAFSDFTNPELHSNATTLLTMLETDYTNDKTLFNTNPAYDLSASNMRGYAIKKADFDGDKNNIIGSTVMNGEDWVVVAKKDDSFIVGKQQSQLQEMNVAPAVEGIFKVGTDDGYVTINPQNINPANNFIDNKISSMLSKNLYANQAKDISRDIAFRQFETLKDAGVLITQEEYAKLAPEFKEQYKKASQSGSVKNPFDDQFGKHYYNQKWVKYFEGSKGFNLGEKKLGKIFGPELGRLASGMAKLVIGATQAIKGPILVYRTSSYVNSVVSNMMIYAINSDDPLSPRKRYSEAKSKYADYKKLLKQSMNTTLDEAGRKAAMKALEQHELHYAFKHGIASTIRSDAYTTGSYKENIIYTQLKSITGDSVMADQMKTVLADPSTKWGSQIGEVFDNTEVIPKLMMFLSNKDSVGPKQAIQQVLLAYPTYNNLGPVLNAIDQISPFTKYLSNYPKMVMYSLSANPKKLALVNALFFMGVRASYGEEISEDEQWFYDHNFANVFGLGGKSWESLNPYWIPSKQLDGFSMVDYAFLPSATSSLANPVKDIVPFTLN